MGTRVRAVFFFIAMLAVFCTFVLPSFAGIDDTWDWKDNKRKLKVYVNAADADKEFGGKKLKDIVKEAMDNWNGVKEDTGWEFANGTAADHDIEVKTGTASGGGAHVTGFPSSSNKDRTVGKLTTVIDPNYKKGWGINDPNKKNPVSTIKHELSHCIRLDHQGGTRSKTGKIKDPQGDDTDNDDVITISEEDKKEAKKASTAPIKTAQASVGSGQGAHLAVRGFPDELPFSVIIEKAEVIIPSDVFLENNTITLSATTLRSMPDPLNVPTGLERMLKGVHISTELPPVVNIGSLFDVIIPFEDGIEGEAFLIDVNDPDWKRLIGSSLRPFYYDHSAAQWVDLPVQFTLDTTNDFLQMQVPSTFLEQYAGTGDGLFLSIAGTPVSDAPTLVLFGTGLLGLAGAMRRRTFVRRK